jgi:hypothetical protein
LQTQIEQLPSIIAHRVAIIQLDTYRKHSRDTSSALRDSRDSRDSTSTRDGSSGLLHRTGGGVGGGRLSPTSET